MTRFFICRGCAHSEELADKTLDRAALIVRDDPGKYSSAIALCCGVAKNVWQEYLREITPDPLENEDIMASHFDDQQFSEREAECLACCLNELDEDDRILITQYHQGMGREKIETRKRLAEQRGGLNKLRITAYRIRHRLYHCITNCLQREQVN